MPDGTELARYPAGQRRAADGGGVLTLDKVMLIEMRDFDRRDATQGGKLTPVEAGVTG